MSAPPFANLTAYAARLRELVPDNKPGYTLTDVVAEALRLYAQDYPATETQDIGNGTLFEWDLSASPFTRFDRGFSEQWPIDVEELDGSGLAQRPRVELSMGVDYYIDERYASGSLKLYLVFVDVPPTNGVRVRFKRRWRVDNETPTPANEVPLHHQEAVVKRAAAYLCEMLSTYYLKTVDAALGSDAFQAMDVVDHYAERGRQYLRQYRDALGTGDETSASFGTCNTNVPRTFPLGYEAGGFGGDL